MKRIEALKLPFIYNKAHSSLKKSWLFLHGILGSSKNFRTITKNKKISNNNDIYIPDLRNHGEAPHSDDNSIEANSEDIIRFLDDNNLETVNILGHSLGGKIGIETALKHPDRIDSLIVVDIGPFDYTKWPKFGKGNYDLIKNLSEINFEGKKLKEIRQEIDDIAKGNTTLSNFLAMNLEHDEKGIRYKSNMAAFEKWYLDIVSHTPEKGLKYEKPTYFIYGTKSGYNPEERFGEINEYFPNCRFSDDVKFVESGHWVHHEKPNEFMEIFQMFDLRE